MSKKEDLLNYIKDCEKADLLNQQIQELDEDIKLVERGLEIVKDKTTIEELALKELHNLRIKRLGLELDLNSVERKILQFELLQELSD